VKPPTRRTVPSRAFERRPFVQLRRLCLGLPETSETSSWGHPNFRAGQKTFCAFEVFGGRPSIAFRVTPADADRLARKEHFFATPYGRGVWVSRWLDVPIDLKLMASLIDRSYRQVATKKLVRFLDSITGLSKASSASAGISRV
jgi:predicted DNA-binding protein (MmcQ/YjbR family)